MKTNVWFVLLVALVQLLSVYGWSSENLPDPMKDPAGCGRGVGGRLCSPDDLLDTTSMSEVHREMNAILAAEAPYSGLYCPAKGENVPLEIMAAVVKKVDGGKADRRRVQRFAKNIHRRFDVGDAQCGSGAVIVISVEDRQVRAAREFQTV